MGIQKMIQKAAIRNSERPRANFKGKRLRSKIAKKGKFSIDM